MNIKIRSRELLDYWTNSFDDKTNLVDFIYRDFNQGVLRQEKKVLLIHARQLYNFSYGFEVFKKDRYKKIAQNLAISFEDIFSNKEGFYYSFTDQKETINCYDQIYLALSLCKYSKVFIDQKTAKKAFELTKRIKEIFQKENSKPIYNKLKLETKQISEIFGNTLLHYLELLINLYKLKDVYFEKELDLENEINATIITFEKYILNLTEGVCYENLDEDFNWKIEEKYGWITNAHVFEWFGFIYEYYLLSNNRSTILDKFEFLVRKLIDRGFQKNGCFWNIYYPYANKSLDIADFWATPEIILGLLYCSKHSGNDNYAILAGKVYDFHEKYFVDEVYGGLYSAVRSDGLIIDRTKGFERKCDHHFFRMCEKIQEYKLLF